MTALHVAQIAHCRLPHRQFIVSAWSLSHRYLMEHHGAPILKSDGFFSG